MSTAALAPPASAQPRPQAQAATRSQPAAAEVQGVVLELQQDELVLDLGSGAGVSENLVVELWRPLKVKHPVTGKVLTDRFKIGQVQIGQVRPTMSLAKVSGTPARTPAPGDIVLFTRAVAPHAPSTPAAASTPVAALSPITSTSPSPSPSPSTPYDEPGTLTPTAAPADVDARNVTEMFEALRGQPVQLRIARYEAFLRAHPDSRFAQVLLEESAALRGLLPGAHRAAAVRATPRPVVVSPPDQLEGISGQPLRVALEIRGTARGAVLHVRRRGDNLYATIPMSASGAGYFAAIIPADRVSDRDLEYFVEAVSDQETVAVLGASSSPERIRVQTTPQVKQPPRGTGSIVILSDYADFNGLRGNDYAFQTEGTFSMRYKDLGIRAVRMGFGVFRGVSGTIDELDEQELAGRPVGLTYGHVETEIGIHKHFSLSARAAVGLLDSGIGGGGQLFARIGNDRGTNLILGGELLGGVGLRSIIQLELATFQRFPILLRAEVTNQPAGFAPDDDDDTLAPRDGAPIAVGQSDVAGRGIVQLGFRITPELVVAVRGSFQGRNINHAGPGFGGSVGYTW